MSRYGVVVYWPDKPDSEEQILLHVVGLPVTFPVNLLGSRAVLETAPTGDCVFDILLNETSRNTLSFLAGNTVGFFSTGPAWQAQPGDRLEIIAQTTPDDTASGLAITLMGEAQEPLNLLTLMQAGASVKATLDHVFLNATLTADASIPKAWMNLGNLFANTILRGEASIITAYLTEVPSLRTTIEPEVGSELNAFLTVTHDQTLFHD